MRQLDASRVRVIGGGLAGCEAAWQLAERGFDVELFEMKPERRTPAQVSDRLAELVCSNSFRSNAPDNAVGLIKVEMRQLGSLIMRAAEVARVPAGDALAVDREVFAAEVEQAIAGHDRITLKQEVVTALPDDDVLTIVATGPLTADELAADIADICGGRLSFYDAIAPIVDAESINLDVAYFKSRWGKGEATDYLNCPMDKAQFHTFLTALREADAVVGKDFEDLKYFEGCLPIEVLAGRGDKTLTFGPMKPVGLEHPETDKRAYAVLQLRKEDIHGTAYNLVGCQTRLKQPAQREVFRLVPGLEEVKFLRYGAIHRNTYLDAPALLDDDLAFRGKEHLAFAGQITGVEGYVESTACGLLVAMLSAARLRGEPRPQLPETTALGGLYRHTRGAHRAKPTAPYEPSNVTWAMMPPPEVRVKKKERKRYLSERAQRAMAAWLAGEGGAPKQAAAG
jgi:methylenetetrahydrofolate--tRNA-(uracil-5-)-methyltransferase